MKRTLVAAALAIGALAGCGRHRSGPLAVAPLPPEIESTFPAANGAHIFYDTDIWAQFRTALDPASVNTHTVFLKVDTARLPCAVHYDPATLRIRITPTDGLDLGRTHTVELTSGLRTADGVPLSSTYFWQFKSIGLRRVESPLPSDGAVDESPVATLMWRETEPAAGSIAYDVFVGPDSVLVANHAVTAIRLPQLSQLFPSARWPLGATRYWSVRASNLDTGESLDGPVWRFATLPEGLPIDSVAVPVAHWEWAIASPPSSLRCNNGLSIGPHFQAGVRWSFESLPSNLRVADVALRLVANGTNPGGHRLSLVAASDDWVPCDFFVGGPPFDDLRPGVLATDTYTRIWNGAFVHVMSSTRLASHAEAAIRYGRSHGYLLHAEQDNNPGDPQSTGSVNVFMVYYYRMPEPRLSSQPISPPARARGARATSRGSVR